MPSFDLQLSDDTESALIARWRAGDRAAAHHLLRREIQPLRRYFSHRVPCRADAEDLAQRTLLASIDALPRFREDVDLSRFVRAIATKLLLRYRRDGARARVRLDTSVQPDAVQAGQPSAFSWVCHEDELQRLRSAFRGLPDDSARLLHLRYWEEQDTSEIARRLELEPGAVRTRLSRARSEMKQALAGMAGSERAKAGQRRCERRAAVWCSAREHNARASFDEKSR
jgi:RNA polymerase sigma factor (sigma-70 family)